MAIDTLAYAKALEAAGLDRRDAEAQVAALATHILPDLATKTDLETLRADLAAMDQRTQTNLGAMEQRLALLIEKAVHQQSWRLFGLVFATVSLLDGILFALLRVVPALH